MAKDTTPPTSPQVHVFKDYQGRALTISINFNESNGNLTGGSVTRDPGCLYQTIYWGVGDDGTPNSTTRQVTVTEGTTNITRQQLNALGLNGRTDITSVNFTVGP